MSHLKCFAQGLNRVFVECDQHMWRLGERELPKGDNILAWKSYHHVWRIKTYKTSDCGFSFQGITVNGGSDWVAMNRRFCQHIIRGKDKLLVDLKHWWNSFPNIAQLWCHNAPYYQCTDFDKISLYTRTIFFFSWLVEIMRVVKVLFQNTRHICI